MELYQKCHWLGYIEYFLQKVLRKFRKKEYIYMRNGERLSPSPST